MAAHDVVDAASLAAADLRGEAAANRPEERAAKAAFLGIQLDLFGRGRSFGEGSAAALAMIAAALDAAAPNDDRRLSQRRFDGLEELAGHYLGCDDDPDDDVNQDVVDHDVSEDGVDHDGAGDDGGDVDDDAEERPSRWQRSATSAPPRPAAS
jgi:hypothetical protein